MHCCSGARDELHLLSWNYVYNGYNHLLSHPSLYLISPTCTYRCPISYAPYRRNASSPFASRLRSCGNATLAPLRKSSSQHSRWVPSFSRGTFAYAYYAAYLRLITRVAGTLPGCKGLEIRNSDSNLCTSQVVAAFLGSLNRQGTSNENVLCST